MKQILSLVAASVIGGLFVLAGVKLFDAPETNTSRTSFTAQSPYQFVNTSPSFATPGFDFKMAAAKATPAVVHIEARESEETALNRKKENDPFSFFFGEEFSFGNPFGFNGPKQGAGSGVIYTEDGYIVTNNHVVEFADEIEVTLSDNRKFNAEIVGTYPNTDLAVLKIEANSLPTLAIGDSDLAQVGEWVLAVGNPLNLTSTVTAGIISAKGRDINIIETNEAIESFIQTDAAVNPGNSGGALVDAEGRLLGINTAISSQTGYFQGYSFAIPVNIMTKIVDDIIEFGSYQRAYLGVGIIELDAEYAQEENLPISQGVIIDQVAEGGSAQYAGLLPKDVIVGVDGRSIKSAPELQEIIGRSKVGDSLKLTVLRNGSERDVDVVLRGAN